MFFARHTSADLSALAWPTARLGEALELLARKSGLASYTLEIPNPTHLNGGDDNQFGHWLGQMAGRLGLEAEPVTMTYTEAPQQVAQAAPALLRLPVGAEREPCFLVLVHSNRRRAILIGSNLATYRVRPQAIAQAISSDLEAPLLGAVERVLSGAQVDPLRRLRARGAILRQWLGQNTIAGCWLLRLSPGASLWSHIRLAQMPRQALALVALNIVQQLLAVLGWWMVGRSALQGHFDWVWLWAWALVLLTAIPFQLLADWFQDMFATGAGVIFKQRLLHGALQLDPEEVRQEGAGQFLERVMESEAVELLALNGGFRVLIGLIGAATAAVVLALGANGWLQVLLFLCWVALALLLGLRALRANQRWTIAHRTMTNDLVERMVGHRTRLAQEDRSRWHTEEDQSLAHYLKLSERAHRGDLELRTFVVRGWLIFGLLGVISSWVFGGSASETLAISLAGVLLASQALADLVGGMQSAISLLIGWQQIAPIYRAAARAAALPATELLRLPESSAATTAEPGTMLVGRDLSFRYRMRAQPVLNGCAVQIRAGDRVLLEGPSGGGKSTLGSILAGLRWPEAGLLLLWGFDQQTLGSAEWRRRIVAAPQFHDNHVLSETFAFNLLMGRRWPATPTDLEEAEIICRELGLGDLLERMPSGMQQMVGESGWQLSHGERSRVYIARALLQRADLIVLDESFAALDPENLQRALNCVFNRAPALLVIAHP